MTTPILSILDPLVILALMLTSLILPALLLRRAHEDRGSIPRQYIEEIRDFLIGVKKEKPRHAVETFLDALRMLGLSRGVSAKIWRGLLGGPISRVLPLWLYRRLLSRLVTSYG
ncbi:MAG: hypothetical protein RMJ28_02430 [Nitrososphaerota archaeon]|nr:hypothetical protein [Candidatus Calditenuaceae archaeon]MDW8073079.1 hypothetical protein [Nitrososphaerota archaeon]